RPDRLNDLLVVVRVSCRYLRVLSFTLSLREFHDKRIANAAVWEVQKIQVRLRDIRADVCTTGTIRARSGPDQNEVSRAAGMPGKARSLYSCLHADAQK